MLLSQRQNAALGSFMAMLATLSWAGNFIAVKFVANELSTFEINFWRWLGALIIIFPLCFHHLKTDWYIIKEQFWLLFFYGFFGFFLSNVFFTIGSETAPAVDMTLIMATSPIMIVLLSGIYFKEHINFTWIFGSFLCFLGVATLVTKGNYLYLADTKFTVGHFWTLGCAGCFAIYSVCMRFFKIQLHLTVFLFVTFLVSVICSLVSVMIFHEEMIFYAKPKSTLPLLYMACFSSVVAFLLWNGAMKKIGAVRAGFMYYLVPVFGTILAILVLNEELNTMQMLGGILVFSGVVFCSCRVDLKIIHRLTHRNKNMEA